MDVNSFQCDYAQFGLCTFLEYEENDDILSNQFVFQISTCFHTV